MNEVTDKQHADRREFDISVEFFPPRDEAAAGRLELCAQRLSILHPDYASVTYGAGGSIHSGTLETLQRLERVSGIPGAAHLTCVGATKNRINTIARDFHKAGVGHIVALRGDLPPDCKRYEPHPDGYAFAVDLVEGLRRIADFRISVAAYPETHPEAVSAKSDLENLKRKLDAGANEAITQFFFDPATYLRFLDRARAIGIEAQIIPGILPIADFDAVLALAANCGTQIPDWLRRRFEGRRSGSEESLQIAVDIATEQCVVLRNHGVKAFHFYTLNQEQLTLRICEQLIATPDEAAVATPNQAVISTTEESRA